MLRIRHTVPFQLVGSNRRYSGGCTPSCSRPCNKHGISLLVDYAKYAGFEDAAHLLRRNSNRTPDWFCEGMRNGNVGFVDVLGFDVTKAKNSDALQEQCFAIKHHVWLEIVVSCDTLISDDVPQSHLYLRGMLRCTRFDRQRGQIARDK